MRVGPYIRYVDDFCVFANDKRFLNELKIGISERLSELRLSLHERKSRIYTVNEGVEFLGFRHMPGTIRVRKQNTLRFKKKMDLMQNKFRKGEMSFEKVTESVVSWVAHVSYADSYNLRKALFKNYIF